SAWHALITSYKEMKQMIEKGKPLTSSIPVVYFSRFEAEPLDEQEVREITQATRVIELWRDIWFIGVDSNDAKGHYRAHVYFTPDREQGHVREGKFLLLGDCRITQYIIRAKDEIRGSSTSRVVAAVFGTNGTTIMSDYIQVTAQLDAMKTAVPTDLDAPFPRPTDMTIDELSEVVDFIRSDSVPQDPRQINARIDTTNPILRIWRKGEIVAIRTGNEGGSSGKGESIRCRKVNGQWVLLSIGIWVN
ncbi:MAG TPA: hypothetical protein VGP99_05090, partial [Tepidisphaeraceae bacterium]|nr:hypothetical protein [Tepidisphaeraceae bacterium]